MTKEVKDIEILKTAGKTRKKRKNLKEIWIWDTHTYFHIGEPLFVIPKNAIKGIRIGGIQKEIEFIYSNFIQDLDSHSYFNFDSLTLDLKSSELDYSRCESLSYADIFMISLVYENGQFEDFKLPHYYYNNLHNILKVHEESDIFRISINDKIDTGNGLVFADCEIYL